MSKNRSYIDQIDELIAHHRHELERLVIARSVLVDLSDGKSANPAVIEATNGSAITIRRISNQPAQPTQKAKKSAPRPNRKAEKEQIRQTILDDLRAMPQTSTTLIEKYRPGGTKNEKQVIYDTLYNLKLNGVIARAEDGIYSLAHTNH